MYLKKPKQTQQQKNFKQMQNNWNAIIRFSPQK